ncbi:uncharacterized protein LOC110182640 [Drosophila serrata]|uniref:uncharacterized protein LOC110182640 n=1 Tax=Drosophila serrata TaxID=7274 RepID=UPI000A1D339E|nr:uncharacterized protein LOC110182640 [Drosophila serrata]KAH8362451.1 hypothetical protein KR200_011216 [Drosophila serrata]
MLRRGESGFASALILSSLCLGLCRGYYSLEVGDPCPTVSYRSRCQALEDCETLSSHLREGRLTIKTVMNCGYTSRSEKICCPVEDAVTPVRIDSSDPSSTTTTTTSSTTTTTTTSSTTTTTTTPAPAPDPADNSDDWLSIFQTDHEYVQGSKTPIPLRPTRDSATFRDTSEGAECIAPLYKGQCRGVSACPTVDTLLLQGRLVDEDVTTCRDGTHEEIICCPLNLPLAPRVQSEPRLGLPDDSTAGKSQPDPQEAAAIARADALLPHYRHLAALAHPNAAFDGHLHHCSAMVLTPQLLLSAAGCQRPSHAVFGVADMRDVDVDEDYLADIVRLAQFQKDLALIRLQDPLNLGRESSANVSVAPICSQFELTRLQVSGSLVAVAWGKGEASDCPLYELPMQLRPNWACEDLPNYGGVKELGSIHLCLSPEGGELALQRFSNETTCVPCPSSVGSVLHLVRPGGSRCVLGIATPTGADCESRVMYFTSLLSPQFRRFVEQEQRN